MPQTDEPNLDLLIKLLKKSQGSDDNETLMAIRAANRQLAKVGGDWEALIRGKVKIIQNPFDSLPKVHRPSNGWKPPQAHEPPPPRYDYQPFSPPPPPPRQPPQPKRAAPQTAPNISQPPLNPTPGQSAIVNFASSGKGWHLRSDEQLKEFSSVAIQKRDGSLVHKVVGKFIEARGGFYYYEIST